MRTSDVRSRVFNFMCAVRSQHGVTSRRLTINYSRQSQQAMGTAVSTVPFCEIRVYLHDNLAANHRTQATT